MQKAKKTIEHYIVFYMDKLGEAQQERYLRQNKLISEIAGRIKMLIELHKILYDGIIDNVHMEVGGKPGEIKFIKKP